MFADVKSTVAPCYVCYPGGSRASVDGPMTGGGSTLKAIAAHAVCVCLGDGNKPIHKPGENSKLRTAGNDEVAISKTTVHDVTENRLDRKIPLEEGRNTNVRANVNQRWCKATGGSSDGPHSHNHIHFH